MANTGLRPNEAKRLENRDASTVNDEGTVETILKVEVRGKSGIGFCKVTLGDVAPLRRHKKRNKGRPTDRILAKLSYQLFNAILDEQDPKFDREKQRRAPSRLGHTYICCRLMEGADTCQIANNCRASVDMVEKYCISLIAPGSMRRRSMLASQIH